MAGYKRRIYDSDNNKAPDVDIQYKQHQIFLENIASDVTQLKTTARAIFVQPKVAIYKLYHELLVINTFESSYITNEADKEKVTKTLLQVEQVIYSDAFTKGLEKDKLTQDIRETISKVTKALLKVAHIYSVSLVECGVKPRPEMREKKASEKEPDYQKAEEKRALETIGAI